MFEKSKQKEIKKDKKTENWKTISKEILRFSVVAKMLFIKKFKNSAIGVKLKEFLLKTTTTTTGSNEAEHLLNKSL